MCIRDRARCAKTRSLFARLSLRFVPDGGSFAFIDLIPRTIASHFLRHLPDGCSRALDFAQKSIPLRLELPALCTRQMLVCTQVDFAPKSTPCCFPPSTAAVLALQTHAAQLQLLP
eukprot:1528129-Rhodomonas_salina.1